MLEPHQADFVWCQDVWCYVSDKDAAVATAARLVKPGGLIVFTDWIKGDTEMSAEEYTNYIEMMSMPNMESVKGYTGLLAKHGCIVELARANETFSERIEMYADYIRKQVKGDVLRMFDFNTNAYDAYMLNWEHKSRLARAGKITHAMFVAKKARQIAKL